MGRAGRYLMRNTIALAALVTGITLGIHGAAFGNDQSPSSAKEMAVASPIAPGSPDVASPAAVNTLTPTYTWSSVPGATRYGIWVAEMVGSNGIGAIYATYTPDEAACADVTRTCSVTPGVVLKDGSVYAWFVMTTSADGDGPWSPGLNFVVHASPPFTVTLIGPGAAVNVAPRIVNTATPAYQWNALPGATRYGLWLGEFVGGSLVNSFYTMYTPEELGCATASLICTAVPDIALTEGSTYGWQVLPTTSAGDASWSDAFYFVVFSVPATLIAPGSPNPATPEVVPSPTPTYYWFPLPGATRYTLWVADTRYRERRLARGVYARPSRVRGRRVHLLRHADDSLEQGQQLRLAGGDVELDR